MLDPNSPLPLYQQLADELSEQIRTGRFKPGSRIPSEHELALHYALGRPTVRQATEVLVRRKVVVRRRGSGTFVNDAPPEVDLLSLGGTLDSFRRSGVTLETRLTRKLKLRRVDADAENPFSGGEAYTLERLGSVERRPLLLERMYFDPAVFPGMDAQPVGSDSLSALIERRYGLSPVGGRQSFRVCRPEPSMLRALKVGARTPLLLVKRTLRFPRAPAAVFAELFCHTDEFVFAQDLGSYP